MKKISVLLLCLGLAGCAATASKMNKINLGMTKQEVIRAIGNPTSTKANEGVEVLEYMLYPCGGLSICEEEPYWVTLKYGKVTQYGRAGDFGSVCPQTEENMI